MIGQELLQAARGERVVGQLLELADLVKFAGRRQDRRQWDYDLELVASIIRRTRPAFQVEARPGLHPEPLDKPVNS